MTDGGVLKISRHRKTEFLERVHLLKLASVCCLEKHFNLLYARTKIDNKF